MLIKIKKYRIDISSLLYGLLLLICYFLPWIHIGVLTFSGVKLPGSLLTLVRIAELNSSLTNMNILVYVLYSVPLLAIITTGLSVVNFKSKLFSTITATVIFCLFFIYYHLFKTFDADLAELFSAIGTGLWITLAASVMILLYTVLYWIWKGPKQSGTTKKIIYSFLFLIGFSLFTVFLIKVNIGKPMENPDTPVEERLDLDKILEEYYVEQDILDQMQGGKKYINLLFDEPEMEWNQGEEPLQQFIRRFTTDADFQLSRVKFPVGEHTILIPGDCPESSPYYDEWFDACVKRVNLTKQNWIMITEDILTQKEPDEESLMSSWTDLEKDVARFVIGWVESELAARYDFSRIDGKWYLTKLDDYLLYEE